MANNFQVLLQGILDKNLTEQDIQSKLREISRDMSKQQNLQVTAHLSKQTENNIKHQLESIVKNISINLGGAFNFSNINVQQQGQKIGQQLGQQVGQAFQSTVGNAVQQTVNNAQQQFRSLSELNTSLLKAPQVIFDNNGLVDTVKTLQAIRDELSAFGEVKFANVPLDDASHIKDMEDFRVIITQLNGDLKHTRELFMHLDGANTMFSDADIKAGERYVQHLDNTKDALHALQTYQANMANGQYTSQLTVWTEKLSQFGKKNVQTKQQMRELEQAYQDLINVNQNGGDLADAMNKFEEAVKGARNTVRELNAQGLGIDENANNAFLKQIEAWETMHSKGAKYLKDTNKSLDGLKEKVQGANKLRLKELKNEFKGLKTEVEKAGKSGKTFGETFKHQMERLAPALGVTTVFRLLKQGFTMALSEVKELDKAMTDLYKVTDETDSTYSRFLKGATESAKELGASITDIVSSTADFARLGYALDDAQKLAEVATIYKNVGDIDIGNATESIVSTMKAFNVEAEDSIQIVDKFNEVGNNFAISSADIGEALKRSASSLATANNTLDESIALITAGNTVIQDASVVGTALKTISLRLTSTTAELKEMGEETEHACETMSDYRELILGLTKNKVDILNDAGEYKNTYNILKEIADVWHEMDSMAQSSLLKTLFGVRQSNIGATILEQFSTAEEVLAKSMESAGSAMRENEKYLDSIEGRTQQLKASFQGFSSALINSDAVKQFITLLTKLLDILTKVVDEIGLLGVAYAGFMTYVAITNKQGLVDLITKIGSTIVQTKGLTSALGVARGALKAFVATPLGWFTLFATAVTVCVGAYDALTVSAKEAREAMEESIQKYDEAKAKTESVTKELDTQREALNKLNKIENPTFAEKEEIEQLQQKTKQLELQLELAKDLEEIAQKQSAKDALTSYQKDFGDRSMESQIDGSKKYVEEVQSGVMNPYVRVPDATPTALTNAIIAYERYTEARKNAFETGNLKGLEDIERGLEDQVTIIKQSIQTMQEQQGAMEDYYLANKGRYDELDTSGKKLIDGYKNIAEKIKYCYSLVDQEAWAKANLDEVFKNPNIEATKDALIQMAKEGRLDPATIKSYGNLSKYLEYLKIDSEEFCKQIYNLVEAEQEATTATDGLTESYKRLNDEQSSSVDKFQSNINALSQALQDMANGKFSNSDLIDLMQRFPELQDETGDLETAIRKLAQTLKNELFASLGDNATQQMKDALNGMYDDAVAVTGISFSDLHNKLQKTTTLLDDVQAEYKQTKTISSETLGSLISQYPQLENAVAKYQAGLMTTQELLDELQKAYQTDYDNYVELLKHKAEDDVEFYNTILSNSTEYYEQLTKYYSDDFENWKSVAEAKAGIEAKLMSKLGEKWNEYYTAVYNAQTGLYELEEKPDAKATAMKNTMDNLLGTNPYDITNPTGILNQQFMSDSKKQQLADEAVKKQQEEQELQRKKAQALINQTNQTLGALNTAIDLQFDEIKLDFKSFTPKTTGEDPKTKEEKKEPYDYRERKIKAMEKALEAQRKEADDVTQSYKEQNEEVDNTISLIDKQIGAYERLKGKYEEDAEAVKLSEIKKERIREGREFKSLAVNSEELQRMEEYARLWDKAQEMQNKAEGLKDLKADYKLSKIDNITDDYEKELEYQDALIEGYEAELDLKKALGETIKESDYDSLIEAQENKKGVYEEYYNAVKAEFDLLNKDKEFKKTEEYKVFKSLLESLQVAIAGCDKEIDNLTDDKMQVWFNDWQKGIDALERTNDEISSLIGLLEDDIFDENGEYTEKSATTLLLYAQSVSNAREQIADYNTAIDKLNKRLKNGKISQEEYNETLAEYKQAQYNLAQSIEEVKNKLIEQRIEAIEANAEAMKSAIQEETDKMKELINAKKEALRAEKELQDYRDSIAEKQKSIASLQTKIAQLERSDSAKDNALARELKAKLAEEEKALQDEINEHSLKEQEEALDKELENYEKAQDDKIKDLDETTKEQIKLIQTSSEEQQRIISEMLTYMTQNYTTAFQGLADIASEYGIKISENLTKPLADVGDLFGGVSVGSGTKNETTETAEDSLKKKQIKAILENGAGTAGVASDLNKYVRKEYGGGKKYLSYVQMAELAELLGIGKYTGKDFKGNEELKNKVLNALKKAGFSTGGMIESNGSAFGDDNVLLRASVGEAILSKQNVADIKNLVDAVPNINRMLDTFGQMLNPANAQTIQKNQQLGGTYNIGSLLQIDNVEGDVGTGVERKIESMLSNLDIEKQLNKLTNRMH